MQSNPFTEDSDLIIDLRVAVMRRALDEYASWQRPDLRLSLNVPTRQLALPDAVATVHEGVLASGVDPRQVDLEIGDSPGSADPTATSEAVQLLRSYGYRVLLDGYGAGWSSFAWVLGLPINGIKLDRAVTATLGTPGGDAVSRALLTLTGDLNLHVIIDGIATPVQAQLAGRLGYRFGQGSLWTDSSMPSGPLTVPE